jgi:hypothetical protein
VGNYLPGELQQNLGVRGYFRVNVTDDSGRYRTMHVHTLVALAFLGQRPAGEQVCHGDGDRTNNALRNLRYDTPTGNQVDIDRHQTRVKGERHEKAKLTEAEVVQIRALLANGELTHKQIGERYGVSGAAIGYIAANRNWRDVGGSAGSVVAPGARKLTLPQVQEIRALRESGVPAKALATRFRVSGTNIYYICRGNSWKARDSASGGAA